MVHSRKLAVLVVIVMSALLLWVYLKPVRVLAPELAGVSCVDETICIDDISKYEEARKLYDEAILSVEASLAQIDQVPRAIFCSTQECAQAFGLSNMAAYDVGTIGMVISPRGWYPYYVKHELTHHVQNEQLGSANAWLLKPDWFVEGMAYSVSEDPRDPLPEKLESYRKRYETWVQDIDKSRLWEEAARL